MSGSVKRGAAVLAILLAYPVGGLLRQQVYAANGESFPIHEARYSDLVDADPAEEHLNRFVVSTRLPVRKVRAQPGVAEAVEVTPGRVAVATRLPRKSLAALPGVTAVEKDPVQSLHSSDPGFHLQWALQNTGQPIDGSSGLAGADIRWVDARGHADGAGVVVAVIDSGIDFNHPDLRHALWRNEGETCGNRHDDDGNGFVDDCHGWDFVNNDNQTLDTRRADGTAVDNSHGTHIAGVIAAAADNGVGIAGIAPNVKIMPIKVVENGPFPTSRTAMAINYAVANGADVINASWGGTNTTTDQTNAVKAASAEGVLIAAAAGNAASDNDARPQYPSAIDVPGMVAVAASTSTDETASFSCWGATSVDLHAPGHMILSTMPNSGYAYMSGTSMAAPHVTAAVALLRSRSPGMPLPDVRHALLSSVDVLDSLAGKTVTGGRLDLASALSIGDDGMEVVFNDFHEFQPGEEHTAQVVIRAPSEVLPAGAPVTVNASLGVLDNGAVRGVLDHPVNATPTDSDAQVLLSDGPLTPTDKVHMTTGGVAFPVTTALPPGDYALMVELLNEDSADRPVIGSPRVVLFSILAPDQPAPEPTPTPTQGAAPTQPSDPGAGGPGPGASPPAPSDPDPGASQPAPSDPGPGTSQPAPSDPDPGVSPPAPSEPKPGMPQPEPDSPLPSSPPPANSEPPQPGPQPTDDYVPIAPPPAVPGPAVPGDSEPDPVGEPKQPVGDWRVFPNKGTTAGGTYVTVNGGGFPDNAYVRFGASNGHVLYQDAGGIRVKTPAHVPGKVDVTVLGRTGQSVVLPGAFTFVEDAPAGGAAPGTPSDPGPGDTSQPDPSDPGVTDPQPPDDTSPPPGSPPPPGNPPTTIAPPPPDDEPVTTVGRTVGRPYTTATGLRVDSFVPGHPMSRLGAGLWGDVACRTASCRGIPLT